jgi:hypothetical protein
MQWTLLNSAVSLTGYWVAAALVDRRWYGRRFMQVRTRGAGGVGAWVGSWAARVRREDSTGLGVGWKQLGLGFGPGLVCPAPFSQNPHETNRRLAS